jgi:DNA invertase Pin-like site-specific DNA recombinase
VDGLDYLKFYDTYVDNGKSGKDFDRPSWNKLMEDIRSGLVDRVCVKDLSRFGRNYIETCEYLEKIFPFMGVRFVSVNDGYDSEKDGGHSEGLIIALKNLMHDRFLKDVSQKVSQSFKAKRERGEFTGGPAPMGYRLSETEKGKLVVNEETSPIIRDIFQWRSEGIGLGVICKRLNEAGVPTCGKRHNKYISHGETEPKTSLWWPASIRRIIKNRVYIGHMVQGKELWKLGKITRTPASEWHVTENTHEPIVSKETWEAANALSGGDFRDNCKNNLPANMFTGVLVCGVCGSKLTRKYDGRKGKTGKVNGMMYYFCPIGYHHKADIDKPYTTWDKLCGALLPLVKTELGRATNLADIIEKRSKRQDNPCDNIKGAISKAAWEIENLVGRLSKLYEDYADNLLSQGDYVRFKAGYEEKVDSLQKKIETLSERLELMSDMSVSGNPWLKAARDFQNPTALTREMLEALVESVTVSGKGNIEVSWKFKDEFELLQICAESEVPDYV